MKKNQIVRLLITLMVVAMMLTALASCEALQGMQGPQGEQGIPGNNGENGKDGVGIISTIIDNKGHLIIYYSDGTFTDCGLITGENGAPGKDGIDGAPGKDGIDGAPGKDGEDGKDGLTPTIEISADGYWIINGVKTEYKAIGTDGKDGVDGAPGKDGVDGAPGKDGEDGKDGVTPTIEISADGYWIINGVKTEYKAIGTDGKDGVDGAPGKDGVDGASGKDGETPTIEISEDGYWIINGVKTEHLAVVVCNHIWQTVTTAPTCTAEGYDTLTCPLCDKSVQVNKTEKLEHTYATSYTTDNDYHWFNCNDCDASKGKEFHALDDDGACTVCGIPIYATPGVIYGVSSDGTYAEVIGYEGTATKVKIASEYQGVPVKKIYNKAFYNNRIIQDVIISNSVTSIGTSAFDSCYSLTSVTIGDSVTIIGDNAFLRCTSLTSITIPDSAIIISHTAFTFCDALYVEYKYGKYIGDYNNPYAVLMEMTNETLSSYEIHEDTKIIANRVFTACSRLTNITIPDNVTSIGEYAFSSCDALTSITIGDSVTSIGSFAISFCPSLTSVIIGDSLSVISDYAFSNCDALTSITLGDSVTSIGSRAFGSCSVLESFTFEGTVEQWNAIPKGERWNFNVPATEVICSDGTVPLK